MLNLMARQEGSKKAECEPQRYNGKKGQGVREEEAKIAAEAALLHTAGPQVGPHAGETAYQGKEQKGAFPRRKRGGCKRCWGEKRTG